MNFIVIRLDTLRWDTLGCTEESREVPVPRDHFRQDARLYVHDRVQTSHYRHENDWFVARTMLEACRWLEDNASGDRWGIFSGRLS